MLDGWASLYPGVRLCPRCGWMLPHGPETCRYPKGPLPQSRKTHGRVRDVALDDELHGLRVGCEFQPLGWAKWSILCMLGKQPGRILPRSQIEAIWDARPDPH